MKDILKAAPTILAPALQAYEQRFSRYGPTAKGVFWKNQNWQYKRYATLENIFDDDARQGGITIHDFGCGYGALFDYLSNRPVMIDSHYTGTDMCQGMIDVAKNRPFDPRATFLCDIKARQVMDYTIVSGTFNMHINADLKKWTNHIQTNLKQLWQHTRRGLAFNMLNHNAKTKYEGLYYADPKVFLDFAQKFLSSNSAMTLDSPLPDFTVYVRRT